MRRKFLHGITELGKTARKSEQQAQQAAKVQ
jgi:hypothetical protein